MKECEPWDWTEKCMRVPLPEGFAIRSNRREVAKYRPGNRG
jgi:hypothetical protein